MDIGKVFGGKDHTTVMHACDQATNEMQQRQGIYNLRYGAYGSIEAGDPTNPPKHMRLPSQNRSESGFSDFRGNPHIVRISVRQNDSPSRNTSGVAGKN